jgi:hypothetical protein
MHVHDGQYTNFEAIFKCRFSLNPCQDGVIGDFPLCFVVLVKNTTMSIQKKNSVIRIFPKL